MTSLTNDARCYYSIDKKEDNCKLFKLTEHQLSLIKASADWIASRAKQTLGSLHYSIEIAIFKQSVEEFLTNRFELLRCANLRTTNPNTNLYILADKAGVPREALPVNISIIVNVTMAYYRINNDPLQHIIMKH